MIRDGVVLREDGIERTLKNPVQQAREYILEAVDMLKRRRQKGDVDEIYES